MSVRIVATVCLAALVGCAGTPEEGGGPSPDTLASRGYDAYNRGYYADATAYFEEALVADPRNAFALRGLEASRDGVLHFGGSRPTKRETDDTIRLVALRGREARARGDLAGAAAYFEDILALAPDNAEALEGLDAVRRKIAAPEIVAAASPAHPVAGEEPEGEYLSIGDYDAPTGRTPEEAIRAWTIPPERYR